MVALSCTLGSFAYTTGDYVFTTDARYKVTGADNLLKNGDFSVANPGDAAFGWTDAAGATLSTEQWTINSSAGPDGKTALVSNSAAEGVTIFQTVPFTQGQTLIVSFKIKGVTAFTSSTTAGEGGYIDVYANADGSANKSADRFQQVADVVAVGTDWTEVSFAFTDTVAGGSTGSLIVTLGRLEAGTVVADFYVQEAKSVYDTRVSDRIINYAEYLANSGEFTSGVDEFKETIASMKEAAADPETSDDASAMASLLESLAEEQEAFLDKSSSDYMDNISNGVISSSWPKYNNKDLKTRGDWTFVGARWGHAQGSEFLSDDMPGSYHKTAGAAYITKVGAPAGRYMFAIDAMALKYSTKKGNNSWHDPDYSYYHPYAQVFVGKDSVKYENIDNRVFNTYTAFGKISDGDTLRVGIAYPEFGDATDKGGSFRIKNAVLRILGVNKEEAARQSLVASIYTQQKVLLERLGYAREDISGTTYPWGKPALQDSVDKYQALYTASLVYVNEEGVDQGIDIPEDYDDVLLDAVRMITRARNTMHTLNEPFTNLVEYVPTAQAKLDNESYKNADATYRAALESEVAKSNSLIASVTATVDSASFANAYTDLQAAIYKFEHSCVTPGNPASETVINPYFLQNSGAKSGKATGWDMTLQSDSKGWWLFGADDRFEGGNKAYVSRGNTAFSQNKAMQKITISMKGYYEFRCQAYATNTNSATYNGMWNGLSGADSARVSGIGLFFGPENRPDSISNVCTTQNTFTEWTIEDVRTYSIGYEKAADGDEVVEFGMDALNNGVPMGNGCNLYGFGSVHVYFWGTKQNYLDGISDVPVDVLKSGSKAVYNLMGVKVANSKANLSKGIYISEGKKFIVK